MTDERGLSEDETPPVLPGPNSVEETEDVGGDDTLDPNE